MSRFPFAPFLPLCLHMLVPCDLCHRSGVHLVRLMWACPFAMASLNLGALMRFFGVDWGSVPHNRETSAVGQLAPLGAWKFVSVVVVSDAATKVMSCLRDMCFVSPFALMWGIQLRLWFGVSAMARISVGAEPFGTAFLLPVWMT